MDKAFIKNVAIIHKLLDLNKSGVLIKKKPYVSVAGHLLMNRDYLKTSQCSPQ